MKSIFSRNWISSRQPRKQRKYRYNAPEHIRRKMLTAKLSKELSEKHGIKSLPVKKGDKVKVMRGYNKGKTGKVTEASIKSLKVFVEKIEIAKKDGSRVPYPLDPSNLMITEFDTQGKKRFKQEAKTNVKQAAASKPSAETKVTQTD